MISLSEEGKRGTLVAKKVHYRPRHRVMELTELGLVPIFRQNRWRKGGYEHKNQTEFYSYNGGQEEASAQFRKHYRYTKESVKALVALLGNELVPKATTNHAFTPTQKLCIALRFYATGTHQSEVGDGE